MFDPLDPLTHDQLSAAALREMAEQSAVVRALAGAGGSIHTPGGVYQGEHPPLTAETEDGETQVTDVATLQIGSGLTLTAGDNPGEAILAADREESVHAEAVGNGSDTSFTITHNLNTRNVLVAIYETGGDYELVHATIQATTVNSITVTFAVAPTTDQYTVVVINAGPGAAQVDGPASSTDNAIARWNGTDGDTLQDSGVTIDDSNNVAGVVALAMTGALSGATAITGTSGGITLSGGTAAQDSLTLRGTTHATPGTVDLLTTSADTSSVREAARIRHTTSGTPAAGYGVRQSYRLPNDSGTETTAGQDDVVWTTATASDESADRVFRTMRAGAITEAGRFTSQGALRLPQISTPDTPPASYGKVYFKSDGDLYALDPAGTETNLATAGDPTEGTLAAAGSTQGDAAAITDDATTVTGADGTKGVILPNNPGMYSVWNSDGSGALLVYPNSGAQISNLGTNQPDSLSAGQMKVYARYSSTQWGDPSGTSI